MAAENELPAGPGKKMISLPFLLVVIVLGVGGYLAGPWLMTQYFVLVDDKATPTPYTASGDAPGMMGMGGMGMGGDGEGPRNAEGEANAGGGRGNFDPEAIFARRDADENGILEGEELSGRMAERVTEIDTDGDGTISKEEFLEGMQNFRPTGGRSRPGGGESNPVESNPEVASPEESDPPESESGSEVTPEPNIEDADTVGSR